MCPLTARMPSDADLVDPLSSLLLYSPVHFQWSGAFLTPKVSWGSKKHISIKNVQEIENFASAYLDDQTSYDFQTWNFFHKCIKGYNIFGR